MTRLQMEDEKMLQPERWETFRETGLLLYINQVLHIFGWAITVNLDDNDNVTDAYPARVRFRGFLEDVITENYKKLNTYLKDNAEDLYKEAWENE